MLWAPPHEVRPSSPKYYVEFMLYLKRGLHTPHIH
jgi:hypothetical protein